MSTIQEALTSVYTIYEQSSDAPDTTSDDWKIRVAYANDSVGKWETEKGMDWKELYVTLSANLAANGTYTLPDAFKRPVGNLIIGTDQYVYARPERYPEDVLSGKRVYTITGKKKGFLLKTSPVPTSLAFTLDYKKYADTFTTGTEAGELEMSDESFLIHDVLMQIYLQDNNSALASVYMQLAAQDLDGMKLENERTTFNNPDTFPDDKFPGFGRR